MLLLPAFQAGAGIRGTKERCLWPKTRRRALGGTLSAGYHPETGKRIIKNVLGKTQAECKAKLSAAMEATRGIDVSRADEYTVATWLRSWYDIYAKPNVRIATADRYQLMVEKTISMQQTPAGFTLRTYTHATRQKQDEAAQTMGSFRAQVM